jgi:hypothetical protein
LGFFVDTVSADVTIRELGITLTHPTVDFDLLARFSATDIRRANSLHTAITGGTLLWKKTAGGAIEPPGDYDEDVARTEQLAEGPGEDESKLVRHKGSPLCEVTDRLASLNKFETKTYQTDVSIETPAGNNITRQLLVTDPLVYRVIGSTTGHKVKLQDATTMKLGRHQWVINESANQIEVRDFGDNSKAFLNPGSRLIALLSNNATTTGVWDVIVTSRSSFQGTAPILANYSANANTGRYLEIFPSRSSDEAPFDIINNSVMIAVSVTASSTSTAQIGFFRMTDLVTPIYTVNMGGNAKIVLKDLNVQLFDGDEIAIRVTSGTIQKPKLAFYVSSN